MRKIDAKGVLIMLAYSITLAIIFITLGVIYQDYGGMSLSVAWTIFLIWFIANGMMLYKKHKISYGNDKIIVSRLSKELLNGKKCGKWETRVDEFSVHDIEKYGSSIALGKKVEWHWSNGGGFCSSTLISFEYSFVLNNGREIGFEGLYFTKKQKEELSQYIYEKTGIKAAEYNLK